MSQQPTDEQSPAEQRQAAHLIANLGLKVAHDMGPQAACEVMLSATLLVLKACIPLDQLRAVVLNALAVMEAGGDPSRHN